MRPGKPGWKGRRAEPGGKPKQTTQDKWCGRGQDAFHKNCLHSWRETLAGTEHPSFGPWELHIGPLKARGKGARCLLFSVLYPSYCSLRMYPSPLGCGFPGQEPGLVTSWVFLIINSSKVALTTPSHLSYHGGETKSQDDMYGQAVMRTPNPGGGLRIRDDSGGGGWALRGQGAKPAFLPEAQ